MSMKHEEITRDIIGAAMTVLNELKPGLDEKLYENALVIELTARGHTVEQQRRHLSNVPVLASPPGNPEPAPQTRLASARVLI